MPAKINKETINISNFLEVLDQKIKELETSLTSLKKDQDDLKSKIKSQKDYSKDKIRKNGQDGIFTDGKNIGIGTFTPNYKLEVNGDIAITGGSNKLYGDTTGEYLKLKHGSGSVLLYGGSVVGLEYNRLWFDTTGTTRMVIKSNKIGINTPSPTALFDINSDILRLRTAKTPASAGAVGNQGDWCWDADFIYICIATNTWKRVAIATW
jgi:hypothetical protein